MEVTDQFSLTNDQKLQVLMRALEQRYRAIDNIRDRVQNVCLWILGLFATGGGILLKAGIPLSLTNKFSLSIMIVVAVLALRIFYFRDLERGFRAQQRIQARIEEVIGLSRKGVFGNDSIFPEEWAVAGTQKGKGRFFSHNYLLIYLGTIFLLCGIWI
jgi:hypothetical protein